MTTSDDLLLHWLRQGWKMRGLSGPSYEERIRREIGLIREKRLQDFFLVTSDAVRWAKRRGIAIGCRGSAVASLACYCLLITEIDPIRYPAMMLERFIDPSRKDLPDIDLDVDDERRDEIRQYLISKYGADHVGNVTNWTRYRGRNSLDDVARVFRIPRAETARLKELVIDRGDGDERQASSLADTEETVPAAAAIFAAHPDLRLAQRLEGNLRGYGVHAGGLIVSTSPLTGLCAMYAHKSGDGKRDLKVLSLDWRDAEYLGMLKLDALGLTTMNVVATACELAGIALEGLWAVPDDDPRVMEAFRAGDVTGIFQLDARATRDVCREVQPRTFMEIADVVALSRPGPLLGGSTRTYIATKPGVSGSPNTHPAMRAITAATRGQLVYQEQLLRVATEVGGFSWEEATRLRKIIHKKLGKAQFMELYGQFEAGALRSGLTPEQAQRLWASMSEAAAYAFNIAHAVSYAKLAYWTMHLKVRHPAEFFCASLRKARDEAVPRLLRDAIAHGLRIAPPHFARSQVSWTLDGGALRAGFCQVPGIAERTAAAILEERSTTDFIVWKDLERVRGVGPKTIETITAFASSPDPFGLSRAKDAVAAVARAARAGRLPVPVPCCDAASLRDGTSGTSDLVYCGIVTKREYRDLAEDERAAGNPEMKGVKRPDLTRSATLKCEDGSSDEQVYIRFSRFGFSRFEADLGEVSPGDAVVVRGTKTEGMGLAVRADRLWAIEI